MQNKETGTKDVRDRDRSKGRRRGKLPKERKNEGAEGEENLRRHRRLSDGNKKGRKTPSYKIEGGLIARQKGEEEEGGTEEKRRRKEDEEEERRILRDMGRNFSFCLSQMDRHN